MEDLNVDVNLRDYFAGQALITFSYHYDAKSCAENCYRFADEMLKERSKNEKV